MVDSQIKKLPSSVIFVKSDDLGGSFCVIVRKTVVYLPEILDKLFVGHRKYALLTSLAQSSNILILFVLLCHVPKLFVS